MNPRIVFLGSPDFAVPILRALQETFRVTAVITQPDRPSGRGKVIQPSPVKIEATNLGIPVLQPEKLKLPVSFDTIKQLAPDMIVVAAYGQILKPEILSLPKYGCINVHASLLPRWRGASPVAAAILAGDKQTGISIMKMDAGIDTGMIFTQKTVDILPDDTSEALTQRLADVGARIIQETIPDIIQGKLRPQPQAQDGVTYASLLHKEDGALDFSKPAEYLERQVRAMSPWPGTYFLHHDLRIKVIKSAVICGKTLGVGERGTAEGEPVVGTSIGALKLVELQPAGKTRMTGAQFLAGARNW